MSIIRALQDNEIPELLRIVANAYPSFELHSPEATAKLKKRLLQALDEGFANRICGLFRDGRLLGGMRWLDFEMNLFEKPVPFGGVGLVAVDLVHKKEQVCKEMIQAFIQHYDEAGTALVGLYGFRLDFYKQMGFGFGNVTHHYRIRPEQFPCTQKDGIRFLTADDGEAIAACYQRYMDGRHGLLAKSQYEINEYSRNDTTHLVGFATSDRIEGYLVYRYQVDGLNTDLQVIEFVYENDTAYRQLCTFLHTQLDQIRWILFNTQDDHFYYQFSNPVNSQSGEVPLHHASSGSEIGIMYRVVNTGRLIEQLADHNFNDVSMNLKIELQDTFHPENSGIYPVRVHEGKMCLDENIGSCPFIRLDVAEFTSLVLGLVPFRKLVRYGLADISDTECLPRIDRLFHCTQKPQCWTRF